MLLRVVRDGIRKAAEGWCGCLKGTLGYPSKVCGHKFERQTAKLSVLLEPYSPVQVHEFLPVGKMGPDSRLLRLHANGAM